MLAASPYHVSASLHAPSHAWRFLRAHSASQLTPCPPNQASAALL